MTPFALLSLWDNQGALLLALVWFIALGGIAMRLLFVRQLSWFGIAGYVALGWAGIAWVYPLTANLGDWALALLIGGGVTYTAGLAFFHWNGFRFGNAIWHVCVLVGAAAHFASISLQLDIAA